MGRYLSRFANAALFVLCCFLLAETANAFFAAWLTPAPADLSTTPPDATRETRSRRERQVILSRNLFNASLFAPTASSAPLEEYLEATQLPLRLLGTAAVSDPTLSWAAVQDLESNKTLLVKIDQEIKGQATVMRIERRRIVLSENGSPRELVFEDSEIPGVTSPPTRSRPRASRPPRSSRRSARRQAPDLGVNVQRLAEDRYSVPRSDVDELLSNPEALFSQARIAPHIEDGEMTGLQVNSIQAGSVLKGVGIENGDVITELNGLAITSAEQMPRILEEISQAGEITFVVNRAGEMRTLSFVPE
jgi:type II secretion system protein C